MTLSRILQAVHRWSASIFAICRNVKACGLLRPAVTEEEPDCRIERLQRSEALLAKAERIGRLGCWEHDLVTGDNIWSANLCRMLGVDPRTTKLSEDLFWKLLHPDDREAVQTVIEGGMKYAQEYEYQSRFILPGGQVRTFYTLGRPVLGPDKKVVKRMGVTQDITVRVEVEHALLESESELRHLSGHLLKTQDEERRIVATEVHDGIGTYVSGLSLALGRIRRYLDEGNPDHQKVIAECSELIQGASTEIRTISYLLHPPTLEVLGLESALTWLVNGFSNTSGIKTSSKIASHLGRFKPEIELTLFRVTQEALNNVYRHSGSKTASVELFRDSTNLVLEIADRGRGIKGRLLEPTRTLTVGISGMRERVENLCGTFSIESAPGKGCVVRASAPLEH